MIELTTLERLAVQQLLQRNEIIANLRSAYESDWGELIGHISGRTEVPPEELTQAYELDPERWVLFKKETPLG